MSGESPLSPENRASEALLSIVNYPPLDILTAVMMAIRIISKILFGLKLPKLKPSPREPQSTSKFIEYSKVL